MGKPKYLLPIIYPPINATVDKAHFFSMIFAYEQCVPWVLNNFLQIYIRRSHYNYNEDKKESSLDFYCLVHVSNNINFYNCPWIESYSIPMEFLTNLNLNLDFILQILIEQNYYIIIKSNCHNHTDIGDNIVRNFLIYGFDSNKKAFYIGTKIGKDYEQIIKSYEDVINICNYKTICLVKIKKEIINNNLGHDVFDISINKILQGIKEYLFFKKSKDNCEYAYGIDCYNALSQMLIDCCKEQSIINITDFYVKKEHSKLMLIRIKYINVENLLDEIELQYQNFYIEFKILINILIKWNFIKKKELLDDTIIRLQRLKEVETNILEKLVYILERNDR